MLLWTLPAGNGCFNGGLVPPALEEVGLISAYRMHANSHQHSHLVWSPDGSQLVAFLRSKTKIDGAISFIVFGSANV